MTHLNQTNKKLPIHFIHSCRPTLPPSCVSRRYFLQGVGFCLSQPFSQITKVVSHLLLHSRSSTKPFGLHPARQILRELLHPTLQVWAPTDDIISPTSTRLTNTLIWIIQVEYQDQYQDQL